eukprot:GSChrysophyteH2.ASY1.ANO1.302.1 assembled CDS
MNTTPPPDHTDMKSGLTNEQVQDIRAEAGFNELPTVEISLWKMFFLQFTGTMPYMLWTCIAITIYTSDWLDMGIILGMLVTNGALGFKEQLEAAHELAKLTQKMEAKINTLRDGVAEMLPTRELVPGDICMLAGGVMIPADFEWIEGDILSVDTAPLTGEPIPRKYPDPKYGLLLCGTTVVSGEAYAVCRKIGDKTEAGAGQADIAKDKASVTLSVFEERVYNVVSIVVGKRGVLLSCLSIIVASIPIALPIVLQVTMALGAGKMAQEFSAIVTQIPALQDISSMTVLCSDKTGTLTTAKITIIPEMAWMPPSFTKEDLALYAYLASNPDKKEDPIDRSVINHFASTFGDKGPELIKDYVKVRAVGFTPVYKRVVFEFEHAKIGKIVVAKGIVGKMLDTACGGRCEQLTPEVEKIDYDLSMAGYKTLGVSLKVGDKPWVFVGVLPQMDPPRLDTEATINALKGAGVRVKMITGDHQNIAKETARKIGLGTDEDKKKIPEILAGAVIRDKAGSEELSRLVDSADGFAQVMPSDKREVVEILRSRGEVVGFTGDGVNDAPALSRAQCGIAVDDATDAAKNAAAMILTSEGLSAVYSAVVESRRIFKKLKAYVTYRFAASIQIVTVLAVLVLMSDCSINPLFIILLALFNDITMLPIAYDYQQASKNPENPDVTRILLTSLVLGLLETGFSLIFAYNSKYWHGKVLYGQYDYLLSAIFIQMFISAELLIFSTRAPSYMLKSHMPSGALVVGVGLGLAVMTIMVILLKDFGQLDGRDVAVIYGYCAVCFLFVDFCKVQLYAYFGESTETLPDRDVIAEELAANNIVMDDKEDSSISAGAGTGTEGVALKSFRGTDIETETRMSIAAERMTAWSISNNDDLKGMDMAEARQSLVDAKHRKSQAPIDGSRTVGRGRAQSKYGVENGRVSMSRDPTTQGQGGGSDRPSMLGGSIRPNVPGAKYARGGGH